MLKRHTTFKIGGPVEFFVEPYDTEDLKLLLNLTRRYKISLLVIGAGSNILASSKGINAVVLRLSSPFFKKMTFKDTILEAASGTRLKDAVLEAQRRGLSGLEFLAGIPGTVGGALAMNAGMGEAGFSIGDLVKSVKVIDRRGKVETLTKKDIKFTYRRSSLAKYIILSASLKLVRKRKLEIAQKLREYLLWRRLNQDSSRPNAGCIFKNPTGQAAGRLIDLCALKGKKIGGASISLKHANFILNYDRADSEDVLKLMNSVTKKVKNKFRISLRPEIKIWQ